MIRLGDYVDVRYNVQSAKDDFEIYKIANDLGQRNNLADNPEGIRRFAHCGKK